MAASHEAESFWPKGEGKANAKAKGKPTPKGGKSGSSLVVATETPDEALFSISNMQLFESGFMLQESSPFPLPVLSMTDLVVTDRQLRLVKHMFGVDLAQKVSAVPDGFTPTSSSVNSDSRVVVVNDLEADFMDLLSGGKFMVDDSPLDNLLPSVSLKDVSEAHQTALRNYICQLVEDEGREVTLASVQTSVDMDLAWIKQLPKGKQMSLISVVVQDSKKLFDTDKKGFVRLLGAAAPAPKS